MRKNWLKLLPFLGITLLYLFPETAVANTSEGPLLQFDTPFWDYMPIFLTRFAINMIIEGIVFFAFGFRKLRSWLVFIITNCITQVFLSVFT